MLGFGKGVGLWSFWLDCGGCGLLLVVAVDSQRDLRWGAGVEEEEEEEGFRL